MIRAGLVLSGGGARGFAHLGVLQMLDECGVSVQAISGVSAGAIAGALYAAGHSPQAILTMWKKSSYFGWSNFSLRKSGFFSMQTIARLLRQYLPEDSFEKLKIPLYITATDYTHHRSAVLHSGSLSTAILASAAVPVVFEPVSIGGILYVDGGLLNNFPTEPLLTDCEVILGCHVNQLADETNTLLQPGKLNVLEKCFHMAIAGSLQSKLAACHWLVEPQLGDCGMFDFSRADEVFERGYKAAMAGKEALLTLINTPHTPALL
ncbi:MAG: patatin-like phospholipase family protein [Chitinophagaceae bacterium]